MLSYLLNSCLPTLKGFFAVETSEFRFVNTILASSNLILEVRRLLLLILDAQDDHLDASLKPSKIKLRWSLSKLNHAVFNICLFPPLFFFYGLYYTDVVSALFVLMTYRFHLQQANKSIVLLGLASLLCRQTNIFWVAIFLGGLQVIRSLARGRQGIEFPERPTFAVIMTESLQHGCLYDPLLSNAHAEGIIKPK